jgi:hypothetical protein
MRAAALIAALAALIASGTTDAQWRQVPDRSIPRTPAGEPELDARAPRARGKPDLSGVWLADSDPLPPEIQTVEGDEPFPRHFINIAADLAPEDVAMQGWAAEIFEQRLASSGGADPGAHCKPTGVPRLSALPLPFKIVQTPRLVLILYEENTVFRQIFLDDREPVEDAVPRWMGYSTGRWEDDALVVDTIGFNDRHWLDGMGHPNSDRLHVIERFRRPTAGHLEIEMTIDDPGAYMKPIVYTIEATVLADEDLLEYFCNENEKDVQHYQ